MLNVEKQQLKPTVAFSKSAQPIPSDFRDGRESDVTERTLAVVRSNKLVHIIPANNNDRFEFRQFLA